MKEPEIVLIAHNMRSANNVGSILRSADSFAIDEVILSGYTPYPPHKNDPRLPHLAARTGRRIAKTALGAEKTVRWSHAEDINDLLADLRRQGYLIAALEQSKGSTNLVGFRPPAKLALIVGREVEGIEPEVMTGVDKVLEIPMLGQKESLNAAVAAAVAMFHLRIDRLAKHK